MQRVQRQQDIKLDKIHVLNVDFTVVPQEIRENPGKQGLFERSPKLWDGECRENRRKWQNNQ
jgi:hypothetical protein